MSPVLKKESVPGAKKEGKTPAPVNCLRAPHVDGPARSVFLFQDLREARRIVRYDLELIGKDRFNKCLTVGDGEARDFFTRYGKALGSVEILLASTEEADRKLAKDMLTKFCAACETAQRYWPHRNFVSDETVARGRALLDKA